MSSAETTQKRSSLHHLRELVEAQANVMIGVATHEVDINDVDGEYRERQRTMRRLCRGLGFDNPNPYDGLWEWYAKWSDDLPTYKSRRVYISNLFKPLRRSIEVIEDETLAADLPGSENLDGWPLVENQVGQLRTRLASCTTSEDAQAVGVLCRDIMISLAQAVYPEWMKDDDVGESAVDQLHAVIDLWAPGSSNQKLRKLLKSTIDHANVVQHRRHGKVEEAALTAEATVSAVRLMRRLRDVWMSDVPF